MARDTVFLSGLEIETTIGIYEWERRIRQKLVFDLEMATDITRAAATDDITDTVDYTALSKRIKVFVGASSFNLVETLTEQVAQIILDEFAVPWVRVRLKKKGAISDAVDVGIMIERGVRD